MVVGQMVDWGLLWWILGGMLVTVASGSVTVVMVVRTLQLCRGAPKRVRLQPRPHPRERL